MSLLVLVLFFFSGACGLIYEVVWSRMMLPIFGRSALAVGTVLAAFMLGLTVGSYLLGRIADRSRNPLRLYSFYEIGVGLAALGTSFLLGRLGPVYVWVHSAFGDRSPAFGVARFLMTFVPMLLPTVLMGGTLPILTRFVVRRVAGVDRDLGLLYAVNTVGAVAGSLASGFFLIRILGVHGTIFAAVAGNLVVGAFAWIASARAPVPLCASSTPPAEETVPQDPPAPRGRTAGGLLLVSFGLSGFTSFAYEVFWTRSLVFLVGNTTYAFTLMLTAFLSGIALGGWGVRFALQRIRNPVGFFAAIEVAVGVFSAVSLPLLFLIVGSASLQDFVSRISGHLGSLALSNFGVAFVLMIVPATLIGATFPLLTRIFLEDLSCTGTTVGKVYAVNTLGNVLGALLPGAIILPVLGIQKGILLTASLNVCLGLVISFSRRREGWFTALAAAGLFAGVFFALGRVPLRFQFPSTDQKPQDEVLYYREGGLVTTKVWSGAELDYRLMSVDGVNIGGTSDSDYKQQILAHLPKLLLKSYRSELTIGLGSGILAGESARHPKLKRIVCVEISRGVIEGARYFSKENYEIVYDPRTQIVEDDIADYLETAPETFDIISADEKTAGKYASNSMSYSTEYYSLLRRHLASGGLVIQWVPTDLPSPQYDLVLRTFLASFPHASLWYFPPVGRFKMSNTFLVGSNQPLAVDPSQMRRAFAENPEAFEGIRKYGLTTAEAVLSHFVAGEGALRAVAPRGPVNSLEQPYYEFYSPADYAVPSPQRILANHRLLLSARGADVARILSEDADSADAPLLLQAFEGEGAFLRAHTLQLRGWDEAALVGAYERAVREAPRDGSLRNEVVAYLHDHATLRAHAKDYPGALSFLGKAVEVFPESGECHYDYGMMLLFLNDRSHGIQELQQAVGRDSRLEPAYRALGLNYAMDGQLDKAATEWRQALALDPNDAEALAYYGIYLADRHADADALACLRRAYRLAPHNPRVLYAAGYLRNRPKGLSSPAS